MEHNVLTVLFTIGICVCIGSAYAKQFYEVLPKALKCEVLDTDIVYNFTCTSKTINRTTVVRTRDLYFQPGVELNDYHVSIQSFRKFGKTFRPVRMGINQDMCIFLNGINSRESAWLQRFLNVNERRKKGNFYDPCPLSVRRYEIDVQSDFSKLPDIVQPGEYRVDTTSYTFKDGVRKDFIFSQSFSDIQSKVSRNMKR